MRPMNSRTLHLRPVVHDALLVIALLHLAMAGTRACEAERSQDVAAPTPLKVPKTWDEAAIASLDVPLADAKFSPKHVPAEYYYRIPVRPIFKSYPVYHPDKEPPGYFENLKAMEPKLVWDGKRTRPRLETDADWIAAGEIVFDAPTSFDSGDGPAGTFAVAEVRDPAWHAKTGAHVDKDGVIPDLRYVIRTKGTVELGSLSCANCHTRTMPDGTFVKGAQGNFAFERARAFSFRSGRRDEAFLRMVAHDNFAAPWRADDPASGADPAPLVERLQRQGVRCVWIQCEQDETDEFQGGAVFYPSTLAPVAAGFEDGRLWRFVDALREAEIEVAA